ncbi:hypothetical protein [Mesorhizobium sp. M1B.F.Ca.ET.045.04.1.1]|uniref:hypothetical protein n=1 Tax=Mesorhizobium sp. M1B.F.Ca.ET.045.04.1.1 TaxID=2493673 RepID=UPI000F7511E6|nr:hypothetical protein [Mesorhizobium sp. M1B.F.Ca.ET.045.04.1.1]AZO29772.1 hypothetical protein EJ071_21800 [Mesorhizobium sp. M1B.F.Ca.ET.045.04.1.1]
MKTKVRILPIPDGLSKDTTAAEIESFAGVIGAEEIDAHVHWGLDKATSMKIDRFWQSTMNPESTAGDRSFWHLLVEAIKPAPGAKPSAVLPTPHHAAALAFSLSRGKMVLDALARPASPLASRERAKEASVNRPWYRQPPQTRVASLDPSIGFASTRMASPEDNEYWLAPYRERTAALLAGDASQNYWPASRTIANAVLTGGQVAADLVEQVYAAHHLTTPDGSESLFCATPEQELAIVQRRLGALLSLPTLQRLFGFAFDLHIENQKIRAALAKLRPARSAESPFVILAPVTDERFSWTLARYQPDPSDSQPQFLPASWDEVGGQKSASIKMGLRNLSDWDAPHPRYDIITIDPPLATESNINHAARGADEGAAIAPASDGVPVLHNGGFRIVEMPDSCAAQALASSNERQIVAVQDADALKVGDRLMIGLKTKQGVLWRSPNYRIVRFEDPSAGYPKDWVEKELARRFHFSGAQRRIELDAVTTVSAVQMCLDSTMPVQTQQSDDGDDSDPATKQAIKIIVDNTIALWGSEPAGVSPPEVGIDGRVITKKKITVVQELDVTRHFSAPSSRNGNPSEFLSPALRFGWPYFAVVAPVFDGGGSVPTHQVGNIVDKNRKLALPPVTDEGGRRFLRHERLNAPMVLILESDVRELDKLKPPQRGADMYVRTTSDGKADVVRSRRLIVPPPVPLQFATLHDVLRDLGPNVTVPSQGLRGLSLLGKRDDNLPSRVRVGRAGFEDSKRPLYYPDPAASILMLGLKLQAETGLAELPFVEPPLPITVGASTWPDTGQPDNPKWPDILPVHIELKAETAPALRGQKKPRIVALGPRWLIGNEKLVSKAQHGAVQVQAVEVHLCPGESLLLQAWLCPTINQLAEWFDAIEAAGVLALNDGSGDVGFTGDPHSACVAALQRLLDVKLGADEIAKASMNACSGAGGLAAPPRQTIRMLAGLVYRELLLRPIAALSTPQTMRLNHAVDNKLIPKPRFGDRLSVTRRIFSGGSPGDGSTPADPSHAAPSVASETPADFLTRTPITDWGLGSNQEGATNVLIGGEINFDPASTAGLNIEVACSAPFGDALDPGTGRTPSQRLNNQWPENFDLEDPRFYGFKIGKDQSIEFPIKRVVALKLDGLPLPTDGRAGMRKYLLEDLMAAAWGDAHPYGKALRAALPSVFSGTGARRLWMRAIPINRHDGLLLESSQQSDKPVEKWPRKGDSFQVWLPSTTRPAPPVIDHVSVALSVKALEPTTGPTSFTVGIEQATILTVYHSRPFFSSGEGEKLALVFWPPGLFSQGVEKDDEGNPLLFTSSRGSAEGPEFYDEDLGPGGRYVTRWGADPLTGETVATKDYPTGPLVDPARLSPDGVRVPRAYMPVPVSDQNWAPHDPSKDSAPPAAASTPTQPSEGGAGSGSPSGIAQSTDQPPSTYLAVALQAFEPRFDPVEELWYFNVALRTDPLSFPRVRLGLVRYQANAREDDVPLEGTEPVRLRVSTPVLEWVKPLPGRRATATCHRRADGFTDVTVIVDGPSAIWQTEARDRQPVRPHMVVELIHRWKINGIDQEEIVTDKDRQPAVCSTWSISDSDSSSIGLFRPLRDGYSWTCLFTVNNFTDEDNYSVVVREGREIARASKIGEKVGETGPNFVADIPLMVKATQNER